MGAIIRRSKKHTALLIIAMAIIVALSSCSNDSTSNRPTSSGPEPSADPDVLPRGWIETPVAFEADELSISGTFVHPKSENKTSAALLIAGSGPTNRDGNSRPNGNENSLKSIAFSLAQDGVASLRYDKIGSGKISAKTLGHYLKSPEDITVSLFTDQALAALSELAEQHGVDTQKMGVIGHSEGALFALQLALKSTDEELRVSWLGLIEPLSRRYLDILKTQLTAQIDSQQKSGTITAAEADDASEQLQSTIHQLRTRGTVPPHLKYNLGKLFSPNNLKFLRQIDRIDPADLGAELPSGFPVLLTCSDADIQVMCSDVAHLASGLKKADVDLAHISLHGVDHVLKEDDSKGSASYNKDLPFSHELAAALKKFTAKLPQ